MRTYLAFAPYVCLAVSLFAVPIHACAPAWKRGEYVGITTESALIIWDEKTQTEHFIRRASFRTGVPSFGFLVPTPTQPKLAAAPDELFQRLEEWTKPEKKTTIVFGVPSAADKSPGSVEELTRQCVAGYDAVVLKANDAEAMRGWLHKHGYDARPQLMDWLEPYIKAGWLITAFQIAKTNKQEDHLSTQAVCMSFQTDKLFFPYREPVDVGSRSDKGGRRLLRLFVLSGQRMQGGLKEPGRQWEGKAVWANALAADRRQELAGLLDADQVPVPEGAWLTVFEDYAETRPGNADLFFSASSDQSPLQRKPIYEEWEIPIIIWCPGSCFLVLAGPFVLWRLLRWRKRRGAATT